MTQDASIFRSPAKINWCLRVIRRRDDGFHEIESLVSPITLYDDLEFMPRSDGTFTLTCDHPDIPLDDDNLIILAAKRLAGLAQRDLGMDCRLTKRIPSGGGLGGGSSNAATTLRALSDLWELDLPEDQLQRLAAELGSDVPLFLADGPIVMTGRGEQIRRVTLCWDGWIVLLLPGMPISTPDVYRAWTPSDAPSSSLLDIIDTSQEVVDATTWMAGAFNMLEKPLRDVCPELDNLRCEAERMADRAVRVSGSGSTMFTAFDSETEANEFAQRAAADLDLEARVARPMTGGQQRTVRGKEVSC
jgi:4-diphosphocytidyl-2-C-methyl-D-erythritol kinase